MTKIRHSLEGFNNRFRMAEERISKLEHKQIKIMPWKEQREKNEKEMH